MYITQGLIEHVGTKNKMLHLMKIFSAGREKGVITPGPIR